jgi:hypothetical protein
MGEAIGDAEGESVSTKASFRVVLDEFPSRVKAGTWVESVTEAIAGIPGEPGGLLAGEMMRLLSAWRLGVERDRCPTVEVARYGPVRVAPVVTVRLRPLPPVVASGIGSSSESSAPSSWPCETSVMNVDGIALVVVVVTAAPFVALPFAWSTVVVCCCCFAEVVLVGMWF